MITAYKWHSIARTTTIGASTGIRVEFGESFKILLTTSIDWGNAVISVQNSNLSNTIVASVRLRQNGIHYYLDLKVSQSFSTDFKIELYDNTYWEESSGVSDLAGATLCIIDDINSLNTPSPTGGDSFWVEDENGDLVPKPKEDGTARGVYTLSFLSAGGKNANAGGGGGGGNGGLTEFSIIFNGTQYDSSNGVATINGSYATIDDVNTAIANLINGAPTTLDTLKEIADAMAANENVVEALEEAIGKKANSTDLGGLAYKNSLNTDDVAEGNTNKYFTNARALAAITGAASTIKSDNLTANRALISNADGKVAVSAVTSTELGYLDGVTSAIQTQFNDTNKKIDDFIGLFNQYFSLGDDVQVLKGLWTNYYLSSGGQNTEGGSGGGGLTSFSIAVNGTTYNSSNGVVTLPNYPTIPTWNTLEGKPTTLAGYGITDALSTSGGTITGDLFIKDNLHKIGYYSGGSTLEIFNDIGHVGLYLTDSGKIQCYQAGTYDLIHSGNYSDYALPLSGGTIEGFVTVSSGGYLNQMTVDRSNGGISLINFSSAGTWVGSLGCNNNVPIFEDTSQISHTLIHSGNYSDYALPKSGGTLTAYDSPLALSSTSARVFQLFKVGTSNKGSIGYANGLMYIGNDTGNYARIGVNDNGIPQYWSDNNAANAQTLIHSGNIGSYNAGSATKLQTARTIWGQSFDGSANVSGVLSDVNQVTFDANKSYGIFRGDWYSNALTRDDLGFYAPRSVFSGNVLIGDSTDNGQKLQINYTDSYTGIELTKIGGDESSIGFKSTVGRSVVGIWGNGLSLWNEGLGLALSIPVSSNNVLIGTTHDSGYKLDVNGTIRGVGIVYADSGIRIGSSALGDVSLGITNAYHNYYIGADSSCGYIYSPNGGYMIAMHTNTGNITIGDNYDNGDRLQVMGNLRVTRYGDRGSYLNITVSDVQVQYNGWDAGDGFVFHDFFSNGNRIARIDGLDNSIIADRCMRTPLIEIASGLSTMSSISTISNYLSFNSRGNEMCFSGNDNGVLYINYRPSHAGYVPVAWRWQAGSSTSWAQMEMGNIYAYGNISASGAITAGTASDRRLKDNICTIDQNKAIKMLMALNPITFTWNKKATELGGFEGLSQGFIAQEYECIIPNSGRAIWGDYRAIDYTKVIPYMVSVEQNHETRLQYLERENNELKQELQTLKREYYGIQ